MKRVRLREIEDVRRAAAALALYAVNGEHGRKVGDPVHDWVTEHRRAQYERALAARIPWAVSMSPYSSCGDLAHWMLMCLGCRDERVVNRGDDGGLRGWAVGANVSRLVGSPWYVDASLMGLPELGDIIHVASPDHVAVLVGVGDQQWLTADYGQPYGARRVCPLRDVATGLQVRGRTLKGYVSLARVVLDETALVPDDFDGVEDDNPYDEDLRVPVGV